MKRLRSVIIFFVVVTMIFSLTSCMAESPKIGENGNWWIGGTDTGVSAQGPQGEKGEKGEQGEQGIPGEQGEQGESGEQGEQGENGKSAYEIYCEKYGYSGTEEEWLAEIHALLSKKQPEQIYDIAYDATVVIECYDKFGNNVSTGSGFFVSSDGLIVTAHHVIEDAYELKVRMPDNTIYNVYSVVGFDIDRDIAMIRLREAVTFSYLELETSGITPGEAAYSFGSPLGFLDSTFSSGIVSSNLRKEIFNEDTGEGYYFVQFTAPVSHGNSGGPLINSYGRVIGVVTSCYTGGEDLNRATFIDELNNIDRSYERSVSEFFDDTVYYQIKCGEVMLSETENNGSIENAEDFKCGDTYQGKTNSNDYDVYRIEVDGNEAVVLDLVYVVNSSVPKLYYPSLYDNELNKLSLTWKSFVTDDLSVFYATVILEPGVYYVNALGYYSNSYTGYYIYSYWRTVSYFNNYKYDLAETDFWPQ